MTQRKGNVLGSAQLRRRALSRWDNEGGAIPQGFDGVSTFVDARPEVPQLTNTELVQLRIRVIALENVVLALLANATDRQLELVRDLAADISPKASSTQHPLTIHAAAQMILHSLLLLHLWLPKPLVERRPLPGARRTVRHTLVLLRARRCRHLGDAAYRPLRLSAALRSYPRSFRICGHIEW